MLLIYLEKGVLGIVSSWREYGSVQSRGVDRGMACLHRSYNSRLFCVSGLQNGDCKQCSHETEDVYPADGAVCSTSLGQHHRGVGVCVGVQGSDEVEQRQDTWMPSFQQ